MKKILLVLFIPFIAQAEVFILKPEVSQVDFLAKGKPALINIKGVGHQLAGKLEYHDQFLAGELSFDLRSLDSGIEMRDDHLKNKYLEVTTYPKATLEFNNFDYEQALKGEVPFKGNLTLHGVTKQVSGNATLNGQKISANFTLQLDQFNISIPSFQGITVAQEVTINVKSELTRVP